MKTDMTVTVIDQPYAVSIARSVASGSDPQIVEWLQHALRRISNTYTDAFGSAEHYYAKELKKLSWVESVTIPTAADVVPDA